MARVGTVVGLGQWLGLGSGRIRAMARVGTVVGLGH